MGQAKRNRAVGIVKGDGYKNLQKAKQKFYYAKVAPLTQKWMIKRGWVIGKNGKWRRKQLGDCTVVINGKLQRQET